MASRSPSRLAQGIPMICRACSTPEKLIVVKRSA
jgi:hypothetical protein